MSQRRLGCPAQFDQNLPFYVDTMHRPDIERLAHVQNAQPAHVTFASVAVGGKPMLYVYE